jgi:hypothetical protein
MNARYPLAVASIILLFSTPALASILSASSQTVQARPAERMDYLDVTAVQGELNVTFGEMADASASSGSLTATAPSVAGEGGFLIASAGNARVSNGSAGGIGGVFGGRGGRDATWSSGGGRGGRDGGHWGSNRGGNRGGRGGRGGNRGGGHGGWNRGGGGGNRGGGVHGAPEPSTWMLLGAGLAVFGGYVMIRRREVLVG